MPTLQYDDIMNLESRYRAQLINTASGPRSSCLIATSSADGVDNLGIFNTVTHLGANPPYLGFIMRPHTVERHTLEYIIASGYYTINHVCTSIIEQAHQTSGKYPAETSEFDAVGLRRYHTSHPVPYVMESRVKLGMQMKEVIDVKTNDTKLIVGKVVELLVDDELVDEAGQIRLDQAASIANGGLYNYYALQHHSDQVYVKI